MESRHLPLPTRANDAVEALTCAVADVDHVELDDIVTLREHVRGQGLACVVYSTHSSSETSPRVRVVVPLAEPVPAETWPRLWPTLNERLFLGLADRAASDPSRFYYLPAAAPDALTIAERWDGLALDWRCLPLADPQPAADQVETAGAGPSETVAPEDMPILERLFSGRHGEHRMRAWTGDYEAFGGNASSADLSIANGLVTYCRGDVTRAERIMRAGAWRPKWDERRGTTTWLGYTFGKALAAYRAWTGTQEAPEEPEASEAPTGETCEQKVLRLERELAQERRAHAQTRAVNAVQQTVIRTQRSEIERLNRQIYADYRLGKVKTLTSSQKEVIRALPRIATKRADYFENDRPIITGETIGSEIGKCATTARTAADLVCSLPGSPIKRVTRYRDDGTYGQLTTYELAVRDPVEILEQFVVIAENLEAKQSSRPQPPKCQQHPEAKVSTLHECGACKEIVELQPLCAKIVRIDPESPPVDAPVLVPAQTVRIAPPVSLPEYAATRPPERPPRCPAPGCGAMEFKPRPDGGWRCLKSAHDPAAYVPAVMGAET